MQENVVTGMADGYGRIARKPATTLLHCSAGFANGIANLLNARKAQSPIVNVVGDSATFHGKFDPPLAADLKSLAKVSSHWVRTSHAATSVGADGAAAVQAARTSPGQVATLILPSDASWNDGGIVADPLAIPSPSMPDATTIDVCARLLRNAKRGLLLLGGSGLMAESLVLAQRISAATGCAMLAQSICGLTQRGSGRLPIERIAYVADDAIAQLKDYDTIILVGTKGAVGFFAYPGKPSFHHDPGATIHTLARVDQNIHEALAALADALGAPRQKSVATAGPKSAYPTGQPTSESFGQLLGAVLPDDAIVVDEAVTFGSRLWTQSHNAAPHDWLMVTGGAIGYGMPCATGAAVAGKGRRVLNIEADGSSMYSFQALWTQARERLPITTVIINNGKYQILIGEYGNVGANPGPTAMNMLDLGNPSLNFVQLANAIGVEAARTTTLEGCADLMRQSFKQNSPFLIELMV